MGNDEVDLRVAHAVEEAQKPQDNLITLSTGVVLRGKQAPPLILMSILGAFPKPKPPAVYMEAMGRAVENPENPDYIDRVKAWEAEQGNVMIAAMITTGTELVKVPDGMEGPDGEKWVEEYALFNLPMQKDSVAWRYLRWVQFKAAPSTDDIGQIMKVVGRLSGVPESAAKSAEAFPRSNQETGRG